MELSICVPLARLPGPHCLRFSVDIMIDGENTPVKRFALPHQVDHLRSARSTRQFDLWQNACASQAALELGEGPVRAIGDVILVPEVHS